MIDRNSLENIKRETEDRWSRGSIDPKLYGFQIQRYTKWNPGLSKELINKYEETIQTTFTDDFVSMLQVMNGTDLPTINVYGSSGISHTESVGIYSYPRDLEVVEARISEAQETRQKIENALLAQGFNLELSAKLVPIYSHRYIVCESDKRRSVVLSIQGADAIVYGETLQQYLQKEFLGFEKAQ